MNTSSFTRPFIHSFTCLLSLVTRHLSLAICLLQFPFGLHAQKNWQQLTDPSLTELSGLFADPPAEYASTLCWGWNGPVDRNFIRKDLDSIYKQGFRAVTIEAGYRMQHPYLSDGWFKTVGIAVEEAKKRGMKVWIIDEGKYPSGFAGGKFTEERPDLRMQAVVVTGKIKLAPSETYNRSVSDSVLSVWAYCPERYQALPVPVRQGRVSFTTSDEEGWELWMSTPQFRTAQTRAVNHPTGGKDTRNSLCDYLNPVAVRQFIDFTHEQYKKYVGKEFAKTVLGFRGDEPDYAHLPWTPGIDRVFEEKKGYDVKPYLTAFLLPVQNEEVKRAKADYWDVWSELFSVSFFRQQADWCADNGIEHITHLNNEHRMPVCIRAEGDPFRDLSQVQIPGVDAIWNQIWPDTINNFPLLASSVAHVYGKPRAFSESFAAYRIPPKTVAEAKYVLDHQFARGINMYEMMFWPSSAGGASQNKNWLSMQGVDRLMTYCNRVSWLLSQGRPAAQLAVYFPTSSMWLGDNESDRHLLSVTQTLLENGYMFDYVDDDALGSDVLRLENATLVNRSNQAYKVLIVPSVSVLSVKAWEKINRFAEQGGKVLFWGYKPSMLTDRSFHSPQPFEQVKGSMHEPSGRLTPIVISCLAGLPFSSGTPSNIRLTHRKIAGEDFLFIFNEGRESATWSFPVSASSQLKTWDAWNGEIRPLKAISTEGNLSLDFQPYEAKIISIKINN